MRVVLRHKQRDEHGAVAIIVALMMVMLCVMAAFVVDFGQAYVNKNQAQAAADAGALAAGKVYMADTRSCALLANDLLLQARALAEANVIRELNLPGSTPVVADLATCETDGTLKIHYGVAYKSPIGLGAIATGSDHVDVEGKAVAAFGHAQKAVGNLRPWMICGTQIPSGTFPSKVLEIGFPGNGHNPPASGCSVDKPGDWWRTGCFNGGGSHGDSIQNVLVGCESTTIVPGQPVGATAAQISSYLLSQCPAGKKNEKVYCLGDDSGRDVKTMAPAWNTLLGQTIAMPVFCDVPQCSPTTITKNGNWPVWKIAAATICGYALHGVRSSDVLPAGECQTLNTDGAKPSHFGPADIGFLVIFKGIIAAGTPQTFEDTKATLRLVE